LEIPTFWLALTLVVVSERVRVARPLDLTFAALPLALIIGSLFLQRSRPQGSGKALTRRSLCRIARRAEVPELGTAVITVYGGIILSRGIQTLNMVALYRTP
jgi:hypothetical protein